MKPNMTISTLFPLLAGFLNRAQRPFEGVAKKTSSEDKKPFNPTAKGAVHKIGKQFHSRNLSGVTPAVYRHTHMGVKKVA